MCILFGPGISPDPSRGRGRTSRPYPVPEKDQDLYEVVSFEGFHDVDPHPESCKCLSSPFSFLSLFLVAMASNLLAKGFGESSKLRAARSLAVASRSAARFGEHVKGVVGVPQEARLARNANRKLEDRRSTTLTTHVL